MRFPTLSPLAVIAALLQPLALHAGDVVTQVSTYAALGAGHYEAIATYEGLVGAGACGLGTFEGIDGEMILLDGVIYRVDVDGKVAVMPESSPTPFCAVVAAFKPDLRIDLEPGLTMQDVCARIDAALVDKSRPAVIQVRGRFMAMKCRSVPGQKQPYPPLGEVVKQQNTFERPQVDGCIVAYWFPQALSAVNAPGFHLHFISDDRQFGGHVLDFMTGEAAAETQGLEEIRIILGE